MHTHICAHARLSSDEGTQSTQPATQPATPLGLKLLTQAAEAPPPEEIKKVTLKDPALEQFDALPLQVCMYDLEILERSSPPSEHIQTWNPNVNQTRPFDRM